MNLPKIDLSAIPDLDTLTGVFGSLVYKGQTLDFDDSLIEVMVFVYEVIIKKG